jgi:hypothetical protein
MKRTIFALLTIVALAMTTGCLHRQCRNNACSNDPCVQQGEGCPVEDGHRCCLLRGCFAKHRQHDGGGQEVAAPGPASGAVAYPYYNLRGPRDFLVRNPQSIGP